MITWKCKDCEFKCTLVSGSASSSPISCPYNYSNSDWMCTEVLDDMLNPIREVIDSKYKIKWGDKFFDEFTVEVFGVPVEQHLNFYRITREAREKLKPKFENNILYIFLDVPK